MNTSTSLHTAICFVVPKRQPPFRERHRELFGELLGAGFEVNELIIESGVQTMEQALFALSNELREPDVVVLVDEQSAVYDFVDFSGRCRASLPAARIVLLAEKTGDSLHHCLRKAGAVHYAVGAADALLIASLCKGSAPLADERLLENRELAGSQALIDEIVPRFSKRDVGGQFSDIRLQTPVAPKGLAVEETVAAVLARPRVRGRVLLVVPPQFNVYGMRIKPAYPSLGVMWVGAMLERAGHACEIVDMDADGADLEAVLARLEEGRFDILGLTAVTPTYPNAVEVAVAAKARLPEVTTILGGIHATVDPIACARNPAFDFVVVGEAEVTAVELVDAIMAGTGDLSAIKGLVYRGRGGDIVATGARPLVPDLDDYPYPAHHLIGSLSRYAPPHATVLPAAPIMVSRGCPGACTYCQTKNIFGRRTRFRSPANVIGEIRRLVYEHGVREVHFLDDVITANKKFVRELCALLKQEPYRLHLEVANGLRADMVSEEILAALKEVGLRNVGFGIESGSDRVLELVKKGITKDQVRRAVRIARDLGLETWGFFIFGLPGDTEASIRETIDFAIELDPKYAKFVFLKPFPGSEVYYQLEEKGLIDSRDYSQYGPYMPPVHHLEGVSHERMIELKQEALWRFYLRPRKIIEHLRGIDSMGKLISLVRGGLFVLRQLTTARRPAHASLHGAGAAHPELLTTLS